MHKRAAGAFACLFVLGCVSAQTFRSGTGKIYPPTRPGDVLVFYAAEDVQRPYEVIGEITASGSSGWDQNEGDLIRKASQEAAKLGANAILVRPLEKATSGQQVMASLFGTNDKNQHVTAIRFTGASPASKSPSIVSPMPKSAAMSDIDQGEQETEITIVMQAPTRIALSGRDSTLVMRSFILDEGTVLEGPSLPLTTVGAVDGELPIVAGKRVRVTWRNTRVGNRATKISMED